LIPFLCVVRVRTLAQFPPAVEEALTFETAGQTLDVDKFDNALVAVDRQLGALFKFIRDYETRSNTCIVVTAPYGHEFSPGASRKYMGVPSERVPLIIEIPDRRQRKIPKEAHLHDLGATLAYLGGVRLPSTVDGVNLVP
jgi:membrane-anchored protein YejM (alkaline phosphatase superfamily)